MPYFNEATGRLSFESLEALYQVLHVAFGDVDRKGTAQRKLQSLRQTNKSFADYYAEFQRYALDSRFNDDSLKA